MLTYYKNLSIILIILNITLWITGIGIYKKKKGTSILAITALIISLFYYIINENYLINPYWIHLLLIIFYLVLDLNLIINKDNYLNIKYTILTILSILIIFVLTDYHRVQSNQLPFFTIYINNDRPFYLGIGYKINAHNGLNPSKEIKTNSYITFQDWFNIININFNDIHILNYDGDFLEITKTNQEGLEIYYQYDTSTIYTLDIESISIKETFIKKDLKTYLENNNIYDLRYLLDVKNQIKATHPDGTILYKRLGINILVCNTKDQNYDIYFGNESLKYEKEYCQ